MERILLVMVGLPARGKSFLARKICRYLRFIGHDARIFNVGSYRRAHLGDHKPAAFFDPNNPDGSEARQRVADTALADALSWLRTGGEVAIYDATNSTRARRAHLLEHAGRASVPVLFIESICHDTSIVESNITDTKLRSPDYVGVAPDAALADFRQRIALYEQAYEQVADPDLSFVQVIDAGRQVVVNRVEGQLLARVVALLLNSRLLRRTIWLTRHGESVFNVRGLIGGDSPLSPRGQDYASALGRHFDSVPEGLVVWTSTLGRAIDTGRHIAAPHVEWRQLDEIDAGICDGMTYAEIAARMPSLASARSSDKLRFRYPQGESYLDVVRRIELLILELERRTAPTVIVSHQAVLRCLYAYLVGEPVEHCPHLAMPLHTLVELTPSAYGSDERRILLAPRVEERPSVMPPPVDEV